MTETTLVHDAKTDVSHSKYICLVLSVEVSQMNLRTSQNVSMFFNTSCCSLIFDLLL